MKDHDIRAGRLSRLSQQATILQRVGADGRGVSDEDGPVLDLDRAPLVLRATGVPAQLSCASLAGSAFSETDAVREWYTDVLAGEATSHLGIFIGDGSNYTAAALLRNAVRRAVTVSWYSWHAYTSRYTDRINRDRLLTHAQIEELSDVSHETYMAAAEDLSLRHVYELLAIVDFDIADLRDFAVPEIVSMLKDRSDAGLTTVITVASEHSDVLEQNPRHLGGRAALLRLFEIDARVFDGR